VHPCRDEFSSSSTAYRNANFPVIRIDARTKDRFIDLLYMRNYTICKGKERWNILLHFPRDAGPSIYFRLFASCHEMRCFRSFAFPRELEWKSTLTTIYFTLQMLWNIKEHSPKSLIDQFVKFFLTIEQSKTSKHSSGSTSIINNIDDFNCR